jgi:hypothetical protein
MLFGLPPIYADYTDYAARASVVQGYNSNTYQAQDDARVPAIRRHPSPFTGVDGMLQMRITNGFGDLHDFRIEARVQHYEPLTAQYQSDDGTINGAWSSRFTLGHRSFLTLNSAATFTTINGTHLSDGTIFQFDPTVARRTYWLDSSEAALTYELSPTWRVRTAVGMIISGTVSEPATLLPNGTSTFHRGLDFAQPYAEASLFKDFSERTTGDFTALYQYSYNLFVLDLTQTPPRNIGPDKLQFLTATFGHTYRFSPELINSFRAGGQVASAPPRDPDQRPVLGPTFGEELSYQREFWQYLLTAGYSYGSLNPRLGAGPTASAAALIIGTPYRRGKWRDFSVMLNAQAGHSILLTGVGQNTVLDFAAGSAEIRYGFNATWGLLAGYDVRYATFQSTQFVPPFLRHLVFIGLSGYWSTDRTIPVLTQFAAPITPG